jgi:enoyl-CoA hydratase/carnithine racemase
LVGTIGLGQSKKLIYSSETFGAERALQIGLADDDAIQFLAEAKQPRPLYAAHPHC